MIQWLEQFHSGPPDVKALVGPFRLEVRKTNHGFYWCVEHIHRHYPPRDICSDPCADIESGKAKCEFVVRKWLTEERDDFNDLIAELESQ